MTARLFAASKRSGSNNGVTAAELPPPPPRPLHTALFGRRDVTGEATQRDDKRCVNDSSLRGVRHEMYNLISEMARRYNNIAWAGRIVGVSKSRLAGGCA